MWGDEQTGPEKFHARNGRGARGSFNTLVNRTCIVGERWLPEAVGGAFGVGSHWRDRQGSPRYIFRCGIESLGRPLAANLSPNIVTFVHLASSCGMPGEGPNQDQYSSAGQHVKSQSCDGFNVKRAKGPRGLWAKQANDCKHKFALPVGKWLLP